MSSTISQIAIITKTGSRACPTERREAWGEKFRFRYTGACGDFLPAPALAGEAGTTGPASTSGSSACPCDGAVTNRPGARHGPRHLRDQSTLMGAYNHQTGVKPHKLVKAADIGDAPIEGVYELDRAYRRNRSLVRQGCGRRNRAAVGRGRPFHHPAHHARAVEARRAARDGSFRRPLRHRSRTVRAQAPSWRTLPLGGRGGRAGPEAHDPDRHPWPCGAPLGVQLRAAA